MLYFIQKTGFPLHREYLLIEHFTSFRRHAFLYIENICWFWWKSVFYFKSGQKKCNFSRYATSFIPLLSSINHWKASNKCRYRQSLWTCFKIVLLTRLTWLVSSCTVPSLGMLADFSGSFLMLSMNSSSAFAPYKVNIINITHS